MNAKNPTKPIVDDSKSINELSKIANELTGVQFTEKHSGMITSRLHKRMVELELATMEDYLNYFKSNRSTEKEKLISLLTTHHTYFFREFSHFEYLTNDYLPKILPEIKKRTDRKLKVWAAACSRGQEVYSLAMFLDFHLKRLDASVTFEILGTDIDTESLSIARNGVYLHEELKTAPLPLVSNHWGRGTGSIAAYVKAKDSLRKYCKFELKNLLSLHENKFTEKFDIIFCRNVFIYFNQEQIAKITNDLLSHLNPSGNLFIGVSETLNGLKLPVVSNGPSIYRHASAQNTSVTASATSVHKIIDHPVVLEKTVSAQEVKPIRVLCVDDSPVILTLLKQILNKDNGFEVVGTAIHGLDAQKKVLELRPDVLTLDIHMPEQTGIEYLEKNFKSGHPPVVMVTSVSREDAAMAGKAFQFGASDFVEKPALSNIAERADEIRTKLRCAVQLKVAPSVSKIDQQFQVNRELLGSDRAMRLISFPVSQRKKIVSLLKEMKGRQPACFLISDAPSIALESIVPELEKESLKKIKFIDQIPAKLLDGDIYLISQSKLSDLNQNHFKGKKTSILVLGEVSSSFAQKISQFSGAQLILEEIGKGKGAAHLIEVASEIVLPTSFIYISDTYLSDVKGSNLAGNL